jgi:hypothetical protein
MRRGRVAAVLAGHGSELWKFDQYPAIKRGDVGKFV